ncbi:CAP domain-containing protein [Phycicoccus sp. CSK15P-2]|uniref:CAP domain-containing protein n=1 Tax=Phycicoccus sp. CSK15P-2 TaxID=2807627 RepID=UPI0019526E10|nr:CAP domain-containing protein [Phycicoccus sp. CSK15P-2]MBM6402736.1 CAP domain-containing protein [Phycicoccus sp. CSK15P-2]
MLHRIAAGASVIITLLGVAALLVVPESPFRLGALEARTTASAVPATDRGALPQTTRSSTPSPTASAAPTLSESPSPTPSTTPTKERSPKPPATKTTKTAKKRTTAAPATRSKPKRTPRTTPRPDPTTAPPPPVAEAPSEAREVLDLTNAERAKAGCAPLAWSSALAKAAGAHSADMAQHDYFSHDSRDGRSFADRINATGYRWSGIAENIAAGQSTPKSVVAAWMNSSGHRANILNCGLKDLGVGVARSSATGNRPYWTQDFGSPR